jgi:hypothetical protein
MSINKKFEDIVDFCLVDVDELGDDIILEEDVFKPRGKSFTDQMPPLVFPFGYMIISSTFTYFEEEDEDGDQE